jgi:hypothetical protein
MFAPMPSRVLPDTVEFEIVAETSRQYAASGAREQAETTGDLNAALSETGPDAYGLPTLTPAPTLLEIVEDEMTPL